MAVRCIATARVESSSRPRWRARPYRDLRLSDLRRRVLRHVHIARGEHAPEAVAV